MAETERVSREKDARITELVDRAKVLVRDLDNTVSDMQKRLQQDGG